MSAIVFEHFNVCDDVAEIIDKEIHKGYMKKICLFINTFIGGEDIEIGLDIDNKLVTSFTQFTSDMRCRGYGPSIFEDMRRYAFWKEVKGDWNKYSVFKSLDNQSYEQIYIWRNGLSWRDGRKSITPYYKASHNTEWYMYTNRHYEMKWQIYKSIAITCGKLYLYNVYELKQFLKENKVKGYSKMKKKELLNLCYKFPDCK